MAEKAFLQIQEAEEQAQALIKDARGKAAQLITGAEEEARQALARRIDDCAQNAAQKKQRAEAAAQATSTAFAEETERQCAVLRQELRARKPQAIETVMEGVAAL